MLVVVWWAYLLAYAWRLGVGAIAPLLKDAFHLTHAQIGGDRRAGVSVGSTAAFGNVGVAVGPPLFGAIVNWTDSYSAAWWLLSGAAIGALVLFGLVRETHAMPHISHLSDAGAT